MKNWHQFVNSITVFQKNHSFDKDPPGLCLQPTIWSTNSLENVGIFQWNTLTIEVPRNFHEKPYFLTVLLQLRCCEETSVSSCVLYLYWRSSDFDFSPRHGLVRSGSRVTAVKFLSSVHKHGEVGTITQCEKKKQIMTKYLHKATSFYTETSRHLMITRKVSYTWRFVEVLSGLINFSWYPFSGLSFLEKG